LNFFLPLKLDFYSLVNRESRQPTVSFGFFFKDHLTRAAWVAGGKLLGLPNHNCLAHYIAFYSLLQWRHRLGQEDASLLLCASARIISGRAAIYGREKGGCAISQAPRERRD
jgi:hypothetical protein